MEPTTRKASSIEEEEEMILETSDQEETLEDKEKKEKKREEEKIKPEEDKPTKRTRDAAGQSTEDQGKGIIQTQTMLIPNDPDLKVAMKEAKEDFNAYAKHFFLQTNILLQETQTT